MYKPPAPASFTIGYQGIAREIITPIHITVPRDLQDDLIKGDNLFESKALWDTGANHCAITSDTASAVGLAPIGKTEIHHADGTAIVNIYLADLYLPNHVCIQAVQMTECKSIPGHFGLLIGMDVITLGDFCITNFQNKTTISYRIPSMHTVDYVKESKDHLRRSIGRNDPCYCGSGKKFKQCHGKDI